MTIMPPSLTEWEDNRPIFSLDESCLTSEDEIGEELSHFKRGIFAEWGANYPLSCTWQEMALLPLGTFFKRKNKVIFNTFLISCSEHWITPPCIAEEMLLYLRVSAIITDNIENENYYRI